MAKHFGTNGVRKLVADMRPEFVTQLVSAFAETIGRRGTIVVGRDMRTSSPLYAHAVMAGLLAAGCRVIDIGIVPSPTVEMEVRHLNADGGVIITASHNPPEWNALKFIDKRGINVSQEQGEVIEERLAQGTFPLASWDALHDVEPYTRALTDHMEKTLAITDVEAIKKRAPRVLLDCGNGTTSLIAPTLFRKLGCHVVTLNAQLDGHFPGRHSEPTEKNLSDLITAMKVIPADIGIAFDGDGDRVIFIDENAQFVMGDRTFALCVLHAKRNTVVTTIATSNVVKDVCQTLYRTKVGAPYIAERLWEVHGDMAGEEVGGVIWPEVSYGKDGIVTAAKMVEFIATTGKKLSELVRELPSYANAKTKVSCPHEKKSAVMEKLRARIDTDAHHVTLIDGIRLDFSDHEWVIMRPSGTENFIRVFAEAQSRDRAMELCRTYEKIVEETVRSVS